MDARTFILISYMILGGFLILFNNFIADFLYKIILFYTNKLKLKDIFFFKVDHKNKDSMRFLTRSFTVMFGIFILAISFYYYLKF